MPTTSLLADRLPMSVAPARARAPAGPPRVRQGLWPVSFAQEALEAPGQGSRSPGAPAARQHRLSGSKPAGHKIQAVRHDTGGTERQPLFYNIPDHIPVTL